MEKTNTRKSSTTTSTPHTAALELSLLSEEWLGDIAQPVATQIRRATARTVVAIEVASVSLRRKHYLSRALDSLATAGASFRLLFAHGHISARVFHEANRRSAQLLAAITALVHTKKAEASCVSLPQLDEDFDEQQPPREVNDVVLIKKRVADVALALAVEDERDRNRPDSEDPDDTPLKS